VRAAVGRGSTGQMAGCSRRSNPCRAGKITGSTSARSLPHRAKQGVRRLTRRVHEPRKRHETTWWLLSARQFLGFRDGPSWFPHSTTSGISFGDASRPPVRRRRVFVPSDLRKPGKRDTGVRRVARCLVHAGLGLVRTVRTSRVDPLVDIAEAHALDGTPLLASAQLRPLTGSSTPELAAYR
jgi:hypothetical protein